MTKLANNKIIIKKLSEDDVVGHGIDSYLIDKDKNLALNVYSRPNFNPFDSEETGLFFAKDLDYQVYNPKNNDLYLEGKICDFRKADEKTKTMHRITFSFSSPIRQVSFDNPLFSNFRSMLKTIMTSPQFASTIKKVDNNDY